MKRIVILFLIILLAFFPLINALVSFAEDTAIPKQQEDDRVYYSDMFFAYSQYFKSPYCTLNQFHNDTQIIIDKVYEDYINSSRFTWTEIKATMLVTTDLKQLLQYMGDASGLTSYTYNNALDKANEEFARQLLSGAKNGKGIGKASKIAKGIKTFAKVYDDTAKLINQQELEALETLSEEEGAEILFTYFEHNKVFFYIEDFTLVDLKETLMPRISDYVRAAGWLNEGLKFYKALAVALMMEDLRMEIIEDILSVAERGSTVYDGMTRLKNQLRNGFVSYFIDTYITKKGLDKITDEVIDWLVEAAITDGGVVFYKAYSAIVNLSSLVVFDLIFDIPDLDEVTCQIVLKEYARELYVKTCNQIDLFSNQFAPSDINTFENLCTGYFAAAKAAMKASEKIVISSDEDSLSETQKRYDEFDGYSEMVETTMAYVSSLPREGRARTTGATWSLSGTYILQNGSDVIEKNTLYLTDGSIAVNIKGDKNDSHLVVPADLSAIVSGNVEIQQLTNKGDLTIDGTLKLVSGKVRSQDDPVVSINSGKLNIMEGCCLYGSSRFYRVELENQGQLCILGNLDISTDAGIIMKKATASLELRGNFFAESVSVVYYTSIFHCCDITSGKVILNGTEQQSLKNFTAHHLEIVNPMGVKYLSNVIVNGEYRVNGMPIDENGFLTTFVSGASFGDNSDFRTVSINDVSVTLNHDITATITGSGSLTIPQGQNARITGDVTLQKLTNNGALTIDGNLELRNRRSSTIRSINTGRTAILGDCVLYGYSSSYRLLLENKGQFCVSGYLSLQSYSGLIMNTQDATFEIGGNFYAAGTSTGAANKYCDFTDGRIVLNGTEQQSIKNLIAPILILENSSEAGTIFTSALTVYTLFDHRGNHFTLYNEGSGSSFVDYDGDDLKDNVDPYPTVGNPCTVTLISEDTQKGTVAYISTGTRQTGAGESISTSGGTTITVLATPTFKYRFVKWVDENGTSVSKAEEFSFVAKKDTTLTAVFAKRTQPITIIADGGTITVPSKAEIESIVSVLAQENDGYIYEEGSLCYNGIPIVDGTFEMPDEPVVLTATFTSNENYFALKEVLDAAKTLTYEAYSPDSFTALQTAIEAADTALINHITEADSQTQIAALQAAVDGLRERTAVSISVKSVPTLYVGISETIQSMVVRVTYDNSYQEKATGWAVFGFDCNQLGEQEITITWDELQATHTVTVKQRPMSKVTIADLPDQLYHADGTEFHPETVLSYPDTGDVLLLGTDYDAVYSNNVVVGTATITLTGKGNYTGTRTKTFTIYCEHDPVVIPAVAPTCTETGLTEGSYCRICNATLTAQTGVAATGHNYVDGLCQNCSDQLERYSVNYVVPDGIEAPENTAIWENETVTLPALEAPEGFKFVGWSEERISLTDAAPTLQSGGKTLSLTESKTYHAAFLYVDQALVTGTGNYYKVLEEPESWAGYYLIVCEDTGYLFDSSKNATTYGFGAETIINEQDESAAKWISAANGDAYFFEIAEITTSTSESKAYTMLGTNGYYIYRSTTSGTSLRSTTNYEMAAQYPFTISLSGISASMDTTRIMKCLTTSNRFRFYLTTQTGDTYANVYLYKKDGGFGTKYYTSDLDVCAALGHAYKTTTVAPTQFSQGYDEHVCARCGDTYCDNYVDAFGIVEDAALKIKFASLTLKSDLTINFYVSKDVLAQYSNPYMVFTKALYDEQGNITGYEETTVTEHLLTGTSGDGTICEGFSFTGVTAREIGSAVTATLYGTKDGLLGKGPTVNYSAKQYAMNQLARTSDANLKTLLVDMLNYGSLAQTYWSYNTANPANGALTAEQQACATQNNPVLASCRELIQNGGATVSFKSVSLSLRERVTINYYLNLPNYTGEVSDLEAHITFTDTDGNERNVVIDSADFVQKQHTDGNLYNVVEFSGLNARQMRTACTCEIFSKTGGQRVSNTVIYSIESYAQVMSSSTEQALVNLIYAMIKYGDATAAYFS